MEGIFEDFAHAVGTALELIAVVLVAVGATEAIVVMVRALRASDNAAQRRAWLRFAHWLVVALTFELAADIVATTLHPSWAELGKLATIAVVRTFLTYFLDRDVEKATDLDRQAHAAIPAC